jgi:hypothetical protein
MNYQPMQYESESIGTRYYGFNNPAYPDTELLFTVDVQNTSQDDALDDEAYALLQALMPDTWHDWKLSSMMEKL